MDDTQALVSVTYQELKDLYIELQNGNPRTHVTYTALANCAMLKFQCGENEKQNLVSGVKKFMRKKK